MDIFNSYATDTKREEEGSWVDLGGGAKLLIARAGNKKYSRLLSTLVEKNKIALDQKTDAADELSDDIMVEVFSKSILLGWQGLSFKGEPITYSVENAAKLLALKDFRTDVATHSKNIDNYRATAEALTTKK